VLKGTLDGRETGLEMLEEIKGSELYGRVKPRAVQCIHNEMVQLWSLGSRRRCQGRVDIRTGKKVRDETSTQLGCGLMWMIVRV
jgi:hypothetical protein